MALRSRLSLCLAIIGALPTSALGASCPLPVLPETFVAESPDPSAIRISADESETRESGTTLLRGHVEIERGHRKLSAEQIEYQRQNDQVTASGNVVFADPFLTLEGDQLQYNLNTDQGTLQNGFYFLKRRWGHGAARTISRQGNVQYLEGARYTGCPPGNLSWELHAEELSLDLSAGHGEARDLSLQFLGLPIFYSPYLSFPLSRQRKSGFLLPSLGNSSHSGTEFSMPYYWNIAPNMDATITPDLIEKRGASLGGEFRYLTEKVEGETQLAFLPSDDLYGDDRKAFLFEHQGAVSDQWDYRVDFNYVSDDQYFEDFGNSLAATSTTHLPRRFETHYDADHWWLRARARSFQTLSGAKPYQELPRVNFGHQGELGSTGFRYRLLAEYAQFDHQTSVVTGRRLDLYPSITYSVRKPHYFIEPKLGLRYTDYDLDDQTAGLDGNPSRSVPVLSVDSGLLFERDVDLWSLGLIQTLEPRLFYLHIPSRNHDDIPLFDTTAYDFNHSQLFRENRFSSVDRIGDANQLTGALTTRMINPRTGRELLQAGIGYIQYFEDREVQLTPAIADDREASSEIVTMLSARLLKGLTTRAEWQWDPHDSHTTRNTLGFRYQPDDQRILNLGYRQRRGVLEQTDFSVAWPVTESWRFVGRSYYSLKENKSIETFAGLEYESCCYAVRFLHRRYIRDLTGDVNRAFMIQLELTGLTSIGNRIDELLADDILGYDSRR